MTCCEARAAYDRFGLTYDLMVRDEWQNSKEIAGSPVSPLLPAPVAGFTRFPNGPIRGFRQAQGTIEAAAETELYGPQFSRAVQRLIRPGSPEA